MKKKKRTILSSILIGTFLLCAIAGGTIYYYLFAPQFHPSKTVYIYVDRDDTADSITNKIKKFGYVTRDVMPSVRTTMYTMYTAVFPEVTKSR